MYFTFFPGIDNFQRLPNIAIDHIDLWFQYQTSMSTYNDKPNRTENKSDRLKCQATGSSLPGDKGIWRILCASIDKKIDLVYNSWTETRTWDKFILELNARVISKLVRSVRASPIILKIIIGNQWVFQVAKNVGSIFVRFLKQFPKSRS